MTRSILRTILTTLALALLFAGSFNLNRTTATALAVDETSPGTKFCMEYCPKGGPFLCAVLQLPDGTVIQCGEPERPD